MSFGTLAFLNPWLLAALATLPLIYWLLKTVPPRPKQIEFPPTRILVGLNNKEKTPAKTPWWLMLIRLLAAALVIFALADPVLNANRKQALKGSGPVVAVIDNGWASGSTWAKRMQTLERIILEAEQQSRPVAIVATAPSAKTISIKIEAPADARTTAAALQPQPFAPDRLPALTALRQALDVAGADGVAASIVWLSDGIDHADAGMEFVGGLKDLAGSGTFALVDFSGTSEPIGLVASVTANGKLVAKVLRTGGATRDGVVVAISARGQRLSEAPFKLSGGARSAEVTFELPLELRNQVTRVEIAMERSAGSVSLLDQRSQWQRVGLLSGEGQEQSQPLLGPLYYIEKAVQPFAEVIRPKDQNLSLGLDAVISQNATVIMMADIGTLSGELKEKVAAWVAKGGVLVRFAGPRLEKGGDDLLPVGLRIGGRALGGALSWSTPQPLAAFEDQSLFTGLAIPPDVSVKRQVLADPAQITPDVKVWARLKDGTPLVTATKRGEGQIVLFHITANSDWSNVPISGLFVEMLRRITQLGGLGTQAAAGDTVAAAQGDATNASATSAPDVLTPVQTLDGFGELKVPPPTAQAITAAKLDAAIASLDHPPGYYGPAGTPRSINVIALKTVLAPLPAVPAGAMLLNYGEEATLPMKPWLLAAALMLLFADIVSVILLQLGSAIWFRRKGASAAAAALAAVLAAPALVSDARAQEPAAHAATSAPPANFATAIAATSKVTFGYVLTGNQSVDNTSKLGLSGLVTILSMRTAVEPGEPMAVDIVKDEIAFFPVLYWPVLDDSAPLPEATLAKIDAYMKQGGVIIFDTRDYGSGVPSGMAMAGERGPALQRLLGRLDVPRLEPVPEDHVLTKSFYLLRSFPGRWDGGQLWVEAQGEAGSAQESKARRSDGVTSIIVTSNDFASAWALDANGRGLFPVVPGGELQREMALRTGVNIVMHALTGNYKADQVHVPALLERLGQ